MRHEQEAGEVACVRATVRLGPVTKVNQQPWQSISGHHYGAILLACVIMAVLFVLGDLDSSLVQTFPMQTETKREMSSNNVKPKAKFVFAIGLEGTGHHLMRQFYFDSPHVKQLRELRLYNTIKELALKLYFQGEPSLFTAWQNMQSWAAQGATSTNSTNNNLNAQGPTTGIPIVQLATIQQEAAKIMTQIMNAIPDAPPDDSKRTITIPVNILASGKSGMMSYPNFEGPYRTLQHPNLNLFYQACNIASVECGHIYLYRDPYSVIKSTSINRPFNEGILQAIQLYETDLAVMAAQLLDHPSQTVGCFGLYKPRVFKDAQMWRQLQTLLGWKSHSRFLTYIERVYKPHKPLTKEQKDKLIPPEWKPMMESMMKSHERNIGICQENMDRNRVDS